jgi:glycolate oxidase iron-sulfur subunit
MVERNRHLPDDLLAACIHCGLCLPTCPTYALTGNEISSPRGRIRLMSAVARDELGVTETFQYEMHFCLDCRACETACPAGVQYGRLVEGARTLIMEEKPHRSRRALLGFALGSRRRLDALAAVLRAYSRSSLRRPMRRLLNGFSETLAAMEDFLPPLDRRRQVPPVLRAMGQRRGRVGFVEGCVQRHTHPGVNADTVAVLARNGFEVRVPSRQGCCGSLSAHTGDLAQARTLVTDLVRSFEPLEELDAIVVNAAGCGSFLKHAERVFHEPEGNGRADRGEAGRGELAAGRAGLFAAKLRDVNEFLIESGWEQPSGRIDARVTYHDPCHLVHGQKVSSAPREILASIPSVELVPLPESTWCCGSAGIYNITHPEAAARMLARKLDNLATTGADILATANPGCFIQLAAGLRRRGLHVELAHPVSLLARSYGLDETHLSTAQRRPISS